MLELWVIGFWIFALDALGLVIDTFVPSFSPPRWVYWAIPAIGFLVANVKLFSDQEDRIVELMSDQENRIVELMSDKANALKAVVQEIEMNKASADHNAAVRGQTSSPGALPFRRLDDYSCREVFLGGRFAFDDSLLQAAREYLQTIKHINTLIASVEASTTRFQSAAGTADSIRRYCSGQLNPTPDSQATGLPDVIDNLQRLIEREISIT
jgi:hypothetical protein